MSTTREQKDAAMNATHAAIANLRTASAGENFTCEAMTDFADEIKRADYWRHVRALAEDVTEEAKRRVKDEGADASEAVSESLHEACDGSAWVIYTRQNFDLLRYSENEDAASEEGLTIVEGDTVNWALLAFCALQADVRKQLGNLESELEAEPTEDATP